MKSRWISHKGKRILYVDFSNFGQDFAPLRTEIEAVLSTLEKQPKNSVLILADFRDTVLSRKSTALIKGSAPQISPHIRRAAVILEDTTGLRNLVVGALARVGGQDAALFDDIEQAQDWLVNDE
ncbi:MAG: hypothetical protein GY832_47445 [Chloroflexi bacterium]|nr:hypothetical protein [Chloroflexota bacterium]